MNKGIDNLMELIEDDLAGIVEALETDRADLAGDRVYSAQVELEQLKKEIKREQRRMEMLSRHRAGA